METHYDVIVIGGGAAGMTAAKFAAGLGKKVTLVEHNKLGGECTWTGCVPSKALIKAADALHTAQNLEQFGIKAAGKNFNTNGVMAHVRSLVKKVYSTHTPDEVEKFGIRVVLNSPEFIDGRTLKINGFKLTADKFILTTGSRPAIPPITGLDEVAYLTNETIFELEKIPESLVILGAGPIGVEMASAFNRLGTDVTLLELKPRILFNEDEELSALLTDVLQREGVKIQTNMRATSVIGDKKTKTFLCLDADGMQHTFAAQHILVATGRTPNVEGMQLENAGVKYNSQGVIVDNQLRTTAKHIFAAGDVVGPYLFSHMAWQQAVVAARNALIPFFKQRINYEHVAWVTFAAPELARAGLTEEQARQQYGNKIKVWRKEYSATDRGRVDLVDTGLAKIICDKRGYILGAHILGPCAGELIHEVQVGKKFRMHFDALHSVIHAYPTYSEVLWHAAKEAYVDRLQRAWYVKLAKKFF